MPEQTAAEALSRVSSFPKFSSGSGAIDGLLGGGFRAGRATELFGRSGSGKTLLAAQTALLAAKSGVASLYVDTEGSFRPERLEQVATARGWEAGDALEKILYVRCDSSSEQMETVRKMPSRPATASCRLVIIDTLTRNFSVDLPGRANLSSRQAALNVHLSEIARDSYLHGRAYVLSNRVTFGALHDVGVGGRTVEQLVQASVRLEREGSRVTATLAPTGDSTTVTISAAGLE